MEKSGPPSLWILDHETKEKKDKKETKKFENVSQNQTKINYGEIGPNKGLY